MRNNLNELISRVSVWRSTRRSIRWEQPGQGDEVAEKQRPPLRGGCVSLKLFQSLWSGLVQVESAVQPGSAAKAAFSLERPCPMKSMAPVLAIV